jgi:sterol desaturase/sphingolipid hydroxylase (fatty acid hydroxylase superfamily)
MMDPMSDRRQGLPDLTVVAIPFYFGGMAAEYLWLRHKAAERGPTAGEYERRDTIASLAMGLGSLVAPLVVPKLLRPFTPGRGRYGKAVLAAALGAVAVTTVADRVVRRSVDARPAEQFGPADGSGTDVTHGPAFPPDLPTSTARKVASVGGVAAVAIGGIAVTTSWASLTAPDRMWRRRLLPALGTGPAAVALAILGWDFIYYWNHRFSHESRYMWAMHVVHHSSERYNLSTALRQPVADALGTTLPYGTLCLLGVAPELITTARSVNLLYQFWIHTETIGRIGRPEAVLNTPSHHRVHHGSNRRYLDRNHGSILIVWDRLFGTFEPEEEPVRYGLTKNINTFNAGRIVGHEYAAILGDVARSTSWRERLSYVVRGPGWAARHRAEAEVAAARSAEPSETAVGRGTPAVPISA